MLGVATAGTISFLWKQLRHSTGLPCVGLKGSVVSSPHSEHLVRVSARTRDPLELRFALHCLQRLGSFTNCLSWKKTCSPAVNTNSAPQSRHVRIRSLYPMAVPEEGIPEIGRDDGSLPVPFPCLSTSCTTRARAAIKKERRCQESPRYAEDWVVSAWNLYRRKGEKFKIATRRLNLVF
jgi:hypothetical protein